MTTAPPAVPDPHTFARSAGQPETERLTARLCAANASPGGPDAGGMEEAGGAGETGGAKSAVGVVGVVLAGGLSSRLGTDKARLRLGSPGDPLKAATSPAPADLDLLTRTALLLRVCTDEVAISCRTAPRTADPTSHQTAHQITRDASPSWRRIPDEQEGGGPVGALCSVLRAEPRPVLALPCDLPFMTEEIVRRLLAAHAARPRDAIMTAFLQLETGRLEPLVAVYEPACRPWFEAAVAAGNRRLSAVVPERLRCCVPYGEDEALPFFNLNSPADLEAARRLAARQARGAARV